MVDTDKFQQEFLAFLQEYDIVEEFMHNVQHFPYMSGNIRYPINDCFRWPVSTFGVSDSSKLHDSYKQAYFPARGYTPTDLLTFLKSATEETPYEYW